MALGSRLSRHKGHYLDRAGSRGPDRSLRRLAADAAAYRPQPLALAVSLLGWGARVLLDRLTRRAPVVWTALAVLVLLVSFLPLLAVEATGAAKAILALMHVAVAAALIPVFSRRKF